MTVTQSSPVAAPTEGPDSGSVRIRRRRKIDFAGYVFLLPWFVGMLFTIIPFGASLVLGFTDYDLLSSPRWVGFDNFAALFQDPRVKQSLIVTFTYTFVSVPLSLIAALGVALVLNRGMRGLPLYRAVYYLPSLLGSSVAVVMLWREIFGNRGVVNKALGLFGIDGPAWVSDPSTALSVLIVLNIWTFGSPMIIFLAGLRQIPMELYEQASIDGAGRLRKFVNITLPMLTPLIFFNVILQMINAFQAFTPAHVISGGTGGPADSTMFYTLYLYIEGFTRFDMGYASALGCILLVLIGILTALNFLFSRFWVFYND